MPKTTEREKRGKRKESAFISSGNSFLFFLNIINGAALVPRSLHRRAHSDDVTRVDRMREVLRGKREIRMKIELLLIGHVEFI